MTNQEMVDIFLESRGMMKMSGPEGDVAPVMPFIIMDAQYCIYRRGISRLKVRHELQRLKKRWAECYTRFNRSFFKAFNQDQQDEIIDKMDDFEEYIDDDIKNIRSEISKCFDSVPHDTREVIADCLTCNILAQSAQIIWSKVYRLYDRKMARECFASSINEEKNNLMKAGEGVCLKEGFNNDIEGVRKYSRKFLDLFYKEGNNVDINNSKPLTTAVDTLCRNIVRWLKKQ